MSLKPCNRATAAARLAVADSFMEQAELARVASNAAKVSKELVKLIDEGYDIVALTASCGLMLKFEWALIVPDDENVKKVAAHTFDIDEYVVDVAKKDGLPGGMTPLPEGAAPADVEVAFQSFFAALPEAVVIMDLPEAVLQESRPRAAQVVEILADSGHGLVTYDKGLNTVMQIASQASVPAATVFRDIDPGTHDVAAMKRFLDQAAFRAGLDGKVILKAEARPETLTALAEWSLGSRAASVVFAPISALLRP